MNLEEPYLTGFLLLLVFDDMVAAVVGLALVLVNFVGRNFG